MRERDERQTHRRATIRKGEREGGRQDQPQCGRKIDRYKKQTDEREGDGQKQVRQKGVRGEESEREADRH